MIKFESVKVGDILYDCHKHRVGNTTMRAMGTWKVKILSKTENGCGVSWNGNPEQWWPRYSVERLRRKPIQRQPTIFDLARAGKA